MAIFGRLDTLSPLFGKTEELEYLQVYLHSLFKPDFLSRIAPMQAGENFQTKLDYGMFAITHCYTLKDRANSFYESHRKYIDFQVVIEGFERYFIGNQDDFKVLNPYDENKDLVIYSPTQEISNILLKAQELCILFPDDVHSVGMGDSSEVGRLVKKVIVKVPQTLIKHRL